MKLLVLSCVLLLAAPCLGFELELEHALKGLFNDWKTSWNKFYVSESEELTRFNIWLHNLLHILHHNVEHRLAKHSYKLAMNEFGDLTHEEFRVRNGYLNKKRNESQLVEYMYELSWLGGELPAVVDWRKKGVVTEVKDQGHCGSCWSFSSTGSLEGQHALKAGGQLVDLSEQNLIDCSSSYGNMGCQGGSMDLAFQYVRDNGGIDTEQSYPYLGENRKCRFNSQNVGATDSGYLDLPEGDEMALKRAVAEIGPISVAIDAGLRSFQFYKSGLYYEPQCDPQSLDHGVLIVGYGAEGNHDYWIVKNSWGTAWGEEGYIRMARNRENHCGIASRASYPLVTARNNKHTTNLNQ